MAGQVMEMGGSNSSDEVSIFAAAVGKTLGEKLQPLVSADSMGFSGRLACFSKKNRRFEVRILEDCHLDG